MQMRNTTAILLTMADATLPAPQIKTTNVTHSDCGTPHATTAASSPLASGSTTPSRTLRPHLRGMLNERLDLVCVSPRLLGLRPKNTDPHRGTRQREDLRLLLLLNGHALFGGGLRNLGGSAQ